MYTYKHSGTNSERTNIMGVNYCIINITNRSFVKEGDCVYSLKDVEYKNGDNTTLEGLDANFIAYEVEDYVGHGKRGMDFWDKLDEFIAPPALPWNSSHDPVSELFPDNIEDNSEDYISVLYSSVVCEKVVEYLRRVSYQPEPEWNMLTFKFCRQYSEIYTLFRIASTDPNKGVMFSID